MAAAAAPAAAAARLPARGLYPLGLLRPHSLAGSQAERGPGHLWCPGMLGGGAIWAALYIRRPWQRARGWAAIWVQVLYSGALVMMCVLVSIGAGLMLEIACVLALIDARHEGGSCSYTPF